MDFTAVETFLRVTALDLGLKILAAIAFRVVGRRIIVRVIALVQAAMASPPPTPVNITKVQQLAG